MQGIITFDPVAWRAQFPQFGNDTEWPDAQLSGLFDMACCFIWPFPWRAVGRKCLTLMLYLMTAHLAESQRMLNAGQATSGVQTGASVDKVSVSLQAPPITSGWQQWLSTTPYGLQLWALLSVRSKGGFYVGGSIERYGYRKAGGIF